MSAATTEIITKAVIRREGQPLLARQRTKSWWFLPGGHVEPGERVEVALVREIAEELGTEAEITGFVGVVEHGYRKDDVTHHELNLVFEVAITDPEPVSQGDHWSSTGCRSTSSPTPTSSPARSRTHSWPPETTERLAGTAGTVERTVAHRMRERELRGSLLPRLCANRTTAVFNDYVDLPNHNSNPEPSGYKAVALSTAGRLPLARLPSPLAALPAVHSDGGVTQSS
jgi:8-oxo-dGTP diphosphatase